MKTNWRSLTAIFFTCIACDFGDTNIDPGKLTDVEVRNLLPAALAQSARNVGSIGPRVTGTVIQYFKGQNAQPEGYTTYMLDEGIMDDYWRSGLFGGAMKDCNLIIRKAAEKNMPHYRGIAKVLMAFNLGIATSFWGDVPYSQAFQNKLNMTPPYDEQVSVYNSIQQLLDDALLDFSRPAGDFAPGQDDLIFRGNIGRWAATARALKARYYMHLTKRDPNAAIKALTILSRGSFQSNADQPDFPFEAEALITASPLAYFAQERADQLALGAYLSSAMNTFTDPRLNYYGVKSGEIYEIYDDTDSQLFWAKNETPLPLISYCELKFIEAEAYLRTGNDMKASAALRAAIEANMIKIGIASASYQSYLTTHSSLSGTLEAKLNLIIRQKYFALYGQGVIEAWVDYRRTGYPAIPLPVGVTVADDFFESKIPIIPRRYLYPQSERNTNGAMWQEAIDRQGGHFLDNDMWAFKN